MGFNLNVLPPNPTKIGSILTRWGKSELNRLIFDPKLVKVRGKESLCHQDRPWGSMVHFGKALRYLSPILFQISQSNFHGQSFLFIPPINSPNRIFFGISFGFHFSKSKNDTFICLNLFNIALIQLYFEIKRFNLGHLLWQIMFER